MAHDPLNTLREFKLKSGRSGRMYSLKALEDQGFGKTSRLPVSLRVVLESVLRNCDGQRISPDVVKALAGWQPNGARTTELPFVLARIMLQDMAGFPALNDFAAMRAEAKRQNFDPARIEPLVPVDLVVDHSIVVDVHNSTDALRRNMEIEFERNGERYTFLKWAKQAFSGIRVVPPGNGICHQVNLEYLSRGVWEKDGIYYPDSAVGTDSHTTMVNAIGVLAWGVGGIEAEAAMLGQPYYFLEPDVVGVHMTGKLNPGVTATDLVLTVTELLRKSNVVNKFVEYFGEGASTLSATDRATVANMAPDYGATCGFFAIDDKTLEYYRMTGREEHCDAIESYLKAQGMFGIPRKGEIDYSQVVELDLSTVRPSVSGPKQPEERLNLEAIKDRFNELFSKPVAESGYNKPAADLDKRFPVANPAVGDVGHGDIGIAAITSCTNTSNPWVLLAAGLLAKKAVEKGMKPHPRVKTSLAPGSKVVTAYLKDAGLMPYLEQLGYHVVAYGCTTCMGLAGPLDKDLEESIVKNDVICAAVLSGNRNFEARVHQSLKANFLMSPPLVIAFALAGTVRIDMDKDPIGNDKDGKPVFLKDLWPTPAEVEAVMKFALNPESFRREYGDLSGAKDLWDGIPEAKGALFDWDDKSTYLLEPPLFEGFSRTLPKVTDVRGGRALGIFGNKLTTDHISPVAPIRKGTLAGDWLVAAGSTDLSSFGSRRTNHEVMVRGAFANPRIKNLMVPGSEGGVTFHQPDGAKMQIFDASMQYQKDKVPLFVFGGEAYGTGSSRDWAAKGTQMLGIKVVVARGYERIHRSNLVGMGVLPCQFKGADSVQSLGITGEESYDLLGVEGGNIKPLQDVTLVIHRKDGSTQNVAVTLRVDSPIEVEYLKNGGILPFVLRELMAA
ncbi:MAG: aconitate hydratase AcnA [Rhodocyclaceae bacterium]|jgi:aconitate hydratase|nr:aconitate hydratase AcnA [Rhodocyclaceae bacterium]MCE2979302.1 aconitate hydratase AcnA [Betaproteobacteria bacterium]MCA3073877.1 aconitate hydratase AcnA [Rhodocyclaceae bacterium]MCA3089248.1 aconitate hydratase AcnA [Rhodocyclaceae bacterium]MCA3092809.1 aconitate hydratase AcnA [Rhodocyclaceae bacterium]